MSHYVSPYARLNIIAKRETFVKPQPTQRYWLLYRGEKVNNTPAVIPVINSLKRSLVSQGWQSSLFTREKVK